MKGKSPVVLEVVPSANRLLRGNALSGLALDLQHDLNRRVIGQPAAVDAVVSLFQQVRFGLRPPGLPAGTFLFTGPTGVGKTHLPKQLSHLVNGGTVQGDHLLMVDCASMQHEPDVGKLIGAGAGYVGHETSVPLLCAATFKKLLSHSGIGIIVFDEVDKACKEVWTLLLSALGEGNLTNGNGESLDFSQMLVFLTSNFGSDEIEKLVRGKMGLYQPSKDVLERDIRHAGEAAVRRKFTPEFRNRLDYEITFHPLTEEHLETILLLQLAQLQDRITRARLKTPAFVISTSEQARSAILKQVSDRKEMGARQVIRAVEKSIVVRLSNLLGGDEIKAGDLVLIDHDAEGFSFRREITGMNREEMNACIRLCYARSACCPTAQQIRKKLKSRVAA